jgi:hypothetical protein
MKKIQWLLPILILGSIFLGLSQTTRAQDDPPGRVARLNYIQGSVSYQVSGDQDWVQADPNRPLTTGDNLWVDKNSRGEFHIGSTSVRLSSETGVSFLNLDDRTVQLQLAQGTIEVHLRHHEAGSAFEIDTPNLAFTLVDGGEYRVSVDPNGNTTSIIVREGRGEVTGGGESFTLEPGQEYSFSGGDQLSYDAQPAPGFDEFEDWCQSRDQRENNSASARYVSRDIDGYYDLDDYGSWQSDPEYGAYWVPSGVAVGWAPYHYGHWVWIGPWGWTWVESEPWGFAPFHYGRWYYVRGVWGWVPGPVVVRPVYAPALVAFVGGGGFGLTVGFGGGFAGVAWYPLGPRDVFVPGYRCSPRYLQNVNITNTRVVNVTQVTNVYNTTIINKNVNVTKINYTYANNAAAVTAVSKETFVNAKPVASSAVRVTPQQIQNARVVEQAPLTPARASYVSSEAKVSKARPPVAFSQKPVVAKLPPAAPVSRERAPGFTNESTEFNRPAPAPAHPNNAEPPARNNTVEPPNRANPNAEPPARNSTFEPPNRSNKNAEPEHVNPPPANNNRNEEERRQVAPPPVKFAPPVRAKEENYDVHPPLNNRPEPPPPPRQESKPAPPPKSPPPSHDHENQHPPHGKR